MLQTTTQPTTDHQTTTAAHRIRSVEIIGGFMDGVRLNLADGLTCLIGGRGTGKTTVLELVRYAAKLGLIDMDLWTN